MNRNRVVSLSGLLLCLLVGGYLRLAGADWGAGNPRDEGGAYAHPDERSVYNKTGELRWDPVERIEGEGFFSYHERAFERRFLDWNSGWNIESFNYGSFPYYVLYALTQFANGRSPDEAKGLLFRIYLIVFLAMLVWVGVRFFRQTRRNEGSPDLGVAIGRPFKFLAGATLAYLFLHWFAPYLFRGGVDPSWRYDNWGILARPISGICGTLTILYLYRIGARLYSRQVGLMAAIFLTFTVLHLQLSHYFTFDAILAFFTTAAIYSLLVFLDAETWWKRWRSILVASVWTGLAMATKFGGILLFVPWLVALILAFWRHRPRVAIYRLATWRAGLHFKLIGVVSFIVIWITAFLAQPFGYLDHGRDELGPYTKLSFVHIDFQYLPDFVPQSAKARLVSIGDRIDPYTENIGLHFGPLHLPDTNRPFQDLVAVGGGKYWRDVDEQRTMALVGGPPWTRQYENTTPFVFQWKNLIYYAIGPPLGFLCLFGLVWGFGKPLYHPTWSEFVVWAWMLPNFFPVHLFHTKFPRYLAPQLPFFCLWAAALAVAAYAYLRRREALQAYRGFRWSYAVLALTLAAVAWSGLYSFSFLGIYTGDHPWTVASQWFDKNVPEGKKLISESWDDSTPWDGRVAHKYRMERHNDTINNDTPAHIERLCKNMEWGDYYCFSSKRNYGSFLQAADNSDNRVRFYKSLFAGHLGYRLVKTFSRPVYVLGFPIRYELADESLSLYDHPTVHIFEKVHAYSAEEMRERVLRPPEWILDITPEQVLTATEDRFILAPRADYAIHVWLGALIVLGWIFWPIAYALFRASPDRGLFASKTLGLLLLTYVSWFGSSVGWWTNRPGATTAALIGWSLVSLLCLKNLGSGMAQFLRERWKLALLSEAIFLLVFAYFLSIRMSNPDLNQGEKAMDSSFVSAVYKTDTFPAPDPWYSDKKINYYYYGHVIVGLFGKWIGVPPEYAYNLAVGTWPALVFVLIFGIVLNLTRSYFGAAIGAFWGIVSGTGKTFFLLAANLNAPGGPLDPRLEFREKYVPHDGLSGYLTDAWGQVRSAFALTWEVFEKVWIAFKTGFDPDSLDRARQANLPRLLNFDAYFWKLSRISKSVQANEFPAWTATFADLHAHLLAMPVGMLFVSLLVAYIQRKSRLWEVAAVRGSAVGAVEVGGPFTSAFQLAIMGFTLGTVWVTNTWDLIGWTGLFFASVALLVLYYRRSWFHAKRWTLGRSIHRMGIWGRRFRTLTWWKMGFLQEILIPFVAVLALGYSLFYPFHRSFATPDRVKGIGWMHQEASGWTTPYEFLQIFGTFLIPLLIGIVFLYWRWIFGRRGAWWKTALWVLIAVELAYWITLLLRAAAKQVFDPAAYTLSSLQGAAFWQYLDSDIAFLVGGFVFLLFLLFLPFFIRRSGTLSQRLSILILLLGLAIVMGCEVVYINEGWSKPDHRLNTVFKLHLQAWLCLSIGIGALLGMWLQRPAELPTVGARITGRVFKYAIGVPLLLVALAFASIFPLMAPYLFSEAEGFQGRSRQIPGEFTVDGLNFMRLRSPDEMAAIEWLRSQVEGTPVVLEAAGEHYDYTRSRISTHTGLPTLLGMPHHSRERGNLPEPRIQDTQILYTSTSRERVRDLLRERQVRYVVVGPAERKIYSSKGGAGLQKFEDWTDLFTAVFHSEVESPGLTIYEVRPDYKLSEDWIAPEAPKEPERLIKEEGLSLLSGHEGYMPGEYREPRGMVTGSDGSIYVSDTFNHRIQCFDPQGKFLWWTGEQGEEPGNFNEPCDVAVDVAGNVYVLDTWNARIQVLSATGGIENIVSGFGGGSRGIAVGPIPLARMEADAWRVPATPELSAPYIVIADTGGRKLPIFTLSGDTAGAWGASGTGFQRLTEPVDVEITPFGLAVADARDAKVKFYDGRGRYLQSWDIPNVADEGTTNEINMLWDGERGRLFVTDPEHDQVYGYDSQGEIRFKTGITGKPTGIARGSDGKIYVAARSRHRIVYMPVLE